MKRSGWLRPCACALALALASCGPFRSVGNFFFGGGPTEGEPGHVTGFLGGVVADEPRAALIGRAMLSRGGDAADAAVAIGFALGVTLPSRAGLGGGGACLAYNPASDSVNKGLPEAVLFLPGATSGAGGDRPAAIPMVARGLFALHARYGRRPFETLISPAEQLARFGVPASRALVRDFQVVAAPLLQDPSARQVFAPNGAPLTEGADLVQPDLGSTLAQIRVAGVGDFYQGALARRIEQASQIAGGPITIADLRNELPRVAPPVTIGVGRDNVSFPPAPADGGPAAAAALQVLQREPSAVGEANAAALAAAASLRGVPSLPPLPASSTFLVLDRDGQAVACALTMDNLFGTGRILPGLGILLAASPRTSPLPLLSTALAWNENIHAFRAETGGSGQEGAALAAAYAMLNALRTNGPMPSPVPEPGRANVIACSRYLPGSPGSCFWATDPRGAGLAIGGE
ncbi:MAG: gamma-glutamyltransferase [Acetobacteraceae bacterium]|nr:gamma-glutamyltransferase [Acetobacteraceae bacterium]